MNNFWKVKEENVVCAHEVSWFSKKIVCTSYIVLGFLGSPAK